MSSAGMTQKPIEVALGALEALEFPSLVWGFVDSYVAEDQLLAAISSVFEKSGIDVNVEDTLEQLEERLLVRYWLSDEGRCYRSRFAEFVRLTVRSKQLFDGRPWRSAPTLVSDYRLDISPRRYPKRDIALEAAVSEFASSGHVFSKAQAAIWGQILEKGGMAFLSRFQVDAFKRIFSGTADLGTIITSGTGSGKTLAFYLPALLVSAECLSKGAEFTKVLSIYPRNELLKDQLTEVYKLARAANPALKKAGKPGFSLGALYGQVPLFAGEKAIKEYSNWAYKKGGYVCPFLRCPDCGSETVWKSEDLNAQLERLSCTECSFVSVLAELRLTRNSITKSPPDFLFSTTEMLNQRMSDTGIRRVFGIGCRKDQKPRFILLDEVHTYIGTTGAQTALLLRRWQKMLGNSVHWVGLSATLEEASQFFGDLSGLFASNIEEIAPNPLDMDEEGADYQILVRTDPSSQAATLSTSIQTLMLLSRMLDPSTDGPSGGLFGRRVFAFTDNLDVINRLYDDFRDAEAYQPWGREDPNREPLAQLRAQDKPEPTERDLDGQLWSMAEDLRGNLRGRLSVSRTTSRDPGVLNKSDVVVATASLEVGFNDPDVGAVLQHKAPHSNASFVQRKGRAGRRRGMRPIMMTVLSDYGRDRLAFQAYEELFSPQIERQRLPVRNGYILRMQAVCALFDWISSIASQQKVNGWSWDALSQPSNQNTKKPFVDIAKNVIRDLVRLDPDRIEAFRRHLKHSLKIDDRTVDLILWEKPRSLLLEALPTLARRLFADWKLAKDPRKHDFYVPYHPLPDFMPRQLFGELNLPEVIIHVPPSSQYDKEREEKLWIRQALTEFTPGKVRRRFADEAGNIAHWYPLDPDQETQAIDVHAYAERSEYLGVLPVDTKGDVRVFRPWAISVSNLHNRQRISHTSTAFWDWNSNFEFQGDPSVVQLSNYSSWRDFIPQLEFYLHRLASAITVRRYAYEGVANLSVHGKTKRIDFHLNDGEAGIPAAIGFAYESDGIRIPLNLPTEEEFAELDLPHDVKRWLATLMYRDRVRDDPKLPNTLNGFRRDWLMQVVWRAGIRLSEEKSISLKKAFQEIATYDDAYDLRAAISATVSQEIIQDPAVMSEGQLERAIYADLSSEGVLSRVCEIAIEVFWSDQIVKGQWLRRVFAHTIAEAALQACVLATPKNTALEGLLTDLVSDGEDLAIVIVESTLGGGGTIEALSERFSEDPRSFFRSMEAALAPSDSENAALGLDKIIIEITKEGDCKDTMGELRTARSSKGRELARIRFAKALSAKGIQYSRALGVSFSTRFVKTGASNTTDELTRKLISFWDGLEAKYEVSLPVRLVASLADSDASIKNDLASVGGAGRELSTAERLLWARDGEIRQFGIQSYNPYRDAWTSDAGLARSVISGDPIEKVSTDSQEWEETIQVALVKRGIVALTSTAGMDGLMKTVVDLISRPVTVGYHNFYPVIDAYREGDGGSPEVVIALRERV